MRAWMTALLVAAATGLAACEPAPRTPAAGEPALWRIADDDSEIWLFGSVHVLPADVHWLSPRIATALDGAEEFVTETNTEDADFPGLAAQYGTLPEGQTLSSLLNAEDAARLARVAGEVNLDMAQVERMRPWLAALNITYLYAALRISMLRARATASMLASRPCWAHAHAPPASALAIWKLRRRKSAYWPISRQPTKRTSSLLPSTNWKKVPTS
ncbi:MAG: hypothetical protein DCF16_04655 [Alphaproteobacteria bacterium]|nr:MAG: hypothetical protein DCF16_04655 [Alphaproteobacteria bacterium]